MENYLSIGEVSKLKGVGIKSLRYYDEIGILKPAYVNPDTGYRYYRPEQLMTLDMIFTCIDLGIPLKSLHRYQNDDGVPMVDEILKEGRKLADEKIAKINGNLAQMENLAEHIAAFREIRQEQGEYRRSFAKRTLLAVPWVGGLDDTLGYMHVTTKLYFRAKELGVVPLYQMGLMFCHGADGVKRYAFLEVNGSAAADDLFTLPGGSFRCRLYSWEDHEKIREAYIDATWSDNSIILACDAYAIHTDGASDPIEIQIYQPAGVAEQCKV